jgi:dTDP-4-amino-4,6-dideoxygalactose transaminase
MIRELEPAAGVIDLPSVCSMPENRRLLRYPVLVQDSLRNWLCNKLQKLGLGASTMYPAALSGLPGLETMINRQSSFPAAEAFAARILTLPTHTHVRIQDVESIRQVLSTSR